MRCQVKQLAERVFNSWQIKSKQHTCRMGRMEKAARTSPSDDSRGKVAMVKQEGDEDPCKPLTAKATRKTIPRKGAARGSVIRRNPRRRYRLGTVALREVNKLQKKENLDIRKPLFAGLCQSIASEIGCRRIRFDKAATDALQIACEAFLVDYFTALKLTALHAKRVTVMLKDSTFLKELMNIFDLTPKTKSIRN
ncbi:hypothetical protein THARTR1_10521 [Trichoderma harzianum]|uniref:Core Histone H2A/H2B/H3 domain-containing protein n=1 Tax=Trichoderma harzianum TaxID=5544 RepID=A0A2K0TNA7_TRIHA|nr:hypothetical protein THARTR1_10521 [Trichoderma harzianum]